MVRGSSGLKRPAAECARPDAAALAAVRRKKQVEEKRANVAARRPLNLAGGPAKTRIKPVAASASASFVGTR